MTSLSQDHLSIDGDQYSDFGLPLFYSTEDVDPVDCCTVGSFLNCPTGFQLDSCTEYMPQRCASLWDDKCTLYVNSITEMDKAITFVRKMATKKYCHLSSTSSCVTKCEPFNPASQVSPSICQDYGNESLRDVNDAIDIGYYWPVNVSPDYMGKCQQTCDTQDPSTLDSKTDHVLSLCLRSGYCQDIITNICQIASDKKTPITDINLLNFCNSVTASPSTVPASVGTSSTPPNVTGPVILPPPVQSLAAKQNMAMPANVSTAFSNFYSNKKVFYRVLILFILIVLIVGYIIYHKHHHRK